MLVKLTYFKSTGKYYTEGQYATKQTDLSEIWDEVRELKQHKNLPGISGNEFYVLVNVPGHEHEHPRLILIGECQ